MDIIKEWVTNIILFILFATVLDMILPNSKFQKYTKMVVGLLLIAIILTPILKLLTYDLEEALLEIPSFSEIHENEIKNLIDLQKNEIQASHNAYIFKQMAVQLKKDAEEELMDRYGFVIADVNFSVDEQSERPFPENVDKMVVKLAEHTDESEVVEAVKPVVIDTNEPLYPEKETAKKQEVIEFLAQKWVIDKKVLEIHIDGGD